MGKTGKTKPKKEKQQKQRSERAIKARAFFKRYWYWFVTIPVLIGVVLGWAYGMGYLGKKEEIPNVDDEIVLAPGSIYIFDVSSQKNKINIAVKDADKDIAEMDGNVLYAMKEGFATVVLTSGKTVKTVLINVQHDTFSWTLRTGTKIKVSDLEAFGKNYVYSNESMSFDVYGEQYFGYEKDKETGTEYYVAKQEGVARLVFFRGEIRIFELIVKIKDDVEKEDYFTSISLENEQVEADFAENGKSKVKKELTLEPGDIYTVEDFPFSGGNMYFESSNSESTRAFQNGYLRADLPGTSLVTVACVGKNGYDYYTLRVKVNVKEVELKKSQGEGIPERDFYVGDTITESDLVARFGTSLFAIQYESQDPSCLKIKGTDPYSFETIAPKDKVIINAYALVDSGKKLIAQYYLTIKEKEDEEE